jgi:hypothetical protein
VSPAFAGIESDEAWAECAVPQVRGSALHAALEVYGRGQLTGVPAPVAAMEAAYRLVWDAEPAVRGHPDAPARFDDGIAVLHAWCVPLDLMQWRRCVLTG